MATQYQKGIADAIVIELIAKELIPGSARCLGANQIGPSTFDFILAPYFPNEAASLKKRCVKDGRQDLYYNSNRRGIHLCRLSGHLTFQPRTFYRTSETGIHHAQKLILRALHSRVACKEDNTRLQTKIMSFLLSQNLDANTLGSATAVSFESVPTSRLKDFLQSDSNQEIIRRQMGRYLRFVYGLN